MRAIIAVVALFPSTVLSAEFQLVCRFGDPNPHREQKWDAHIDHASWVDEEHVVFWSKAHSVSCLAVPAERIAWKLEGIRGIGSWSVSTTAKRLAFDEHSGERIGDNKGISIIDCANGKRLAQLDRAALARLLRLDFAIADEIVLSPIDGKLHVCVFAQSYGRNAYTVDASYRRLESTFEIDATPREVSLSPDGRYLSVIAERRVLCVRDMSDKQEVFFQGDRVAKKPESLTFTIDAPFLSHVRSDGRTVVYTEDNSWATGKLFIYELATKNMRSFDARNGHIEMDVHFPSRRIVLTGTEAGLTLMDFGGKILADLKTATRQRNCAVEFSPAGNRVAVGSWDGALYVFEIVD